MNNHFSGPIRDENPCKDCPDKYDRPTCRKCCPKDAEWHKELERVKDNRRRYERRAGIGFEHIKNGGK